MSAALLVLPLVWATDAQAQPTQPNPVQKAPPEPVRPQIAFYRKYTEAMLRRYAHMSLELGRVPSLMGREMFRAKVTNCVVHGFDDVVIFVHDIEQCLKKLDPEKQKMLQRIGVQQYTVKEIARLMHLPDRTLVRRYGQALDSLTRILLDRKLLNPLAACQEQEIAK